MRVVVSFLIVVGASQLGADAFVIAPSRLSPCVAFPAACKKCAFLMTASERAVNAMEELVVSSEEEESAVAIPDGSAATGRKPYLLTGLPRPKYRGALVGFLHRTKLWYILAATYVAMAFKRSALSPVPLSPVDLGLRVAAALISSANIFVSDRYHNADLKEETYTRAHELFWMRLDYLGISAILTYNQFLWSGNCGWHARTRLAAAYSGACLACVGFLSPKLDGDRDGSTKLVKYITGTQFVPAMTYLVLTMGGALTRNVLIYTLYASGLVLYVSKRPKRDTVGFHEIFHCLVVAGHIASMGFDLVDLTAPVVRVAAAQWVHKAAPPSMQALPLVLAPWMLLFALLPNKRRLFDKLRRLLANSSD